MTLTLPFNDHVAEYEEWYKKYPFVFKSEVAAIRELMPKGENIHGIEVGLGTGRFAKALGIKEGIEPAANMRALALKKKIFVMNAVAEKLPYKSLQFDFVLMNSCISYFTDVQDAFKEALRVLKRKGCLIVGFIDKNSRIGKYYEDRKPKSIFYKHANFYSVNKVEEELKKAGFKELQFSQTLFHALDKTESTETPLPGYGKGSFVLVKAVK
ncbi:class I SAM-dependent methyltransferase [Ginsengibacter hankyongi]|uniref:Class I SAM-dependent methyltransferase n=1 Tax=Ginsengibacter hankyongi TaxID=2607284 RepID=A0A5J5IAJ1_9BACT|nr:class I SAM-dependent methyltransferase [Ginsengibacter hankyongi]KAA9035651.1 class I SAM-dependent methyltransferase [Ginsengibacter hankyongi]